MLTKEQLLEYAEREAEKFENEGSSYLAHDMYSYRIGFSAAVEMLWPCVRALETIGHDTDITCGRDDPRYCCFEVAQSALIQVTKTMESIE